MRFKAMLLGMALTSLACAPVWADPAAPAPNADPIAAYRAYEAAIKAGKLVEATSFAHDAWQAAEVKWGARNPNTAGLANNAAWTAALNNQPAKGIEPAQRAITLAPVAQQVYRPEEAAFLLAYNDFFAANADDQPKKSEELLKAAKAVQGAWSDILIVDALIAVSYALVLNNKSGQANDAASLSLSELERINPSDTRRRPMALLVKGISRMRLGEPLDAQSDVLDAQLAYGKMRRPDDADWGKLQAWGLVMDSVARSAGARDNQTGSRLRNNRRSPRYLTDDEEKLIYDRKPECADQPAPRRIEGDAIRALAASRNWIHIGGVFARVDIKADGRIENPRILGVVPEQDFSRQVLKALNTWRYEVQPGTLEECRKDLNIAVVFSIN